MPSPFPGVDPYLEDPAYWPDFHSRFVNLWCEAIADQLPGDYEASINERVYLAESDPDSRKLIIPDVAVSQGEWSPGGSSAGQGIVVLEPQTVPLEIVDGYRESYIEILHQSERTLIAVLELLSPTNKVDPGRIEYLQKRRSIVYQPVHLVELDLLQGGVRPKLAKPWPVGDYYYLVSRHETRPDAQVYSWRLPDALPVVPVPLRAPDPDVTVDLAAVYSAAYDRGRFARRLPYRGPCKIPLSHEAQQWVAGIVG